MNAQRENGVWLIPDSYQSARLSQTKRLRQNGMELAELEAHLEDRERTLITTLLASMRLEARIARYRKWQLPLVAFGAFLALVAEAAVRAWWFS